MKEIGWYIELDTYTGAMLHEKAIALNCGRGALEYHYAADILPIPVDQRYGIEDMKYLVEVINRVSSERA